MTELIVFLLVSVLILATALLLAGRKGGVRMFVSADGNLPWAACGLSLFISFFSAGTFVAWGSVAYRDGLVAITIQETMCLAGLVVAAWRKTGMRGGEVALSGSILKYYPAIRDDVLWRLRDALPDTQFIEPRGSASFGAAKLAMTAL